MAVYMEGSLTQFNAAAALIAGGAFVYALQGDQAAAPGPYVIAAAVMAGGGVPLVWRFDRGTVTQAAFIGAHAAAVQVGDISALRP